FGQSGARQAFSLAQQLTPLAKKPPSTAIVSPTTKLAASEAKNTHAPHSSAAFPNRAKGVRANSSLPRAVSSKRERLRSVGKTPGALAFTHTPSLPHSMASDLVSAITAALLTLYAATSKNAT